MSAPEAKEPPESALQDICDRIALFAGQAVDAAGNVLIDLDLKRLAGINLRLRIVRLGPGAIGLHARRPPADAQSGEDLRRLLHTLRGRGIRIVRVTVNDDDEFGLGNH